ncbi:MAG: DUF1566 domain-containing protein [Planctomycetes bacterium]|nr:DUF1566 domain-containing protein [Planctomycetota bacterium]
MRRILVVCFCVLAGFVLAASLLAPRFAVRAAVGAGTAGQNGDVNGDRRLDISDPIYILRFLFSDGPAPVACADSPELVARVEALEDTNRRIADALGELVNPCRKRSDRFVDNGDGTVTDTCTKLMWQKKTEASVSWDGAVQYAGGLELAGHSDWRLPTLRELEGILLGGRAEPDAAPVFGIWNNGFYWSADVSVSVPGYAWVTSFSGAAGPSLFVRGNAGGAYVLAVRGPVTTP